MSDIQYIRKQCLSFICISLYYPPNKLYVKVTDRHLCYIIFKTAIQQARCSDEPATVDVQKNV